jgi:hypothetical protein
VLNDDEYKQWGSGFRPGGIEQWHPVVLLDKKFGVRWGDNGGGPSCGEDWGGVLAPFIGQGHQEATSRGRSMVAASVTPRVAEGLIKLIKLQLSPNARLNQDTRFRIKFKCKNLRFQVLFSVDRLTQLGNFDNLWESNQSLLQKAKFFLLTCSTIVQIYKNYGGHQVFISRV